ncbi:hypothetical protein EJ04DRAFT_530015 [Polyplosphaeria fusca]|uniref:Uncharacterized protein n=1 Tax=Polyplosphaeria fusca TaxID=682080 RepID=A0A9P4QGA6_9PLEO|nr:hypothetical protein EJ04DRAFT_530015 [Polyplosphaeria fusca]
MKQAESSALFFMLWICRPGSGDTDENISSNRPAIPLSDELAFWPLSAKSQGTQFHDERDSLCYDPPYFRQPDLSPLKLTRLEQIVAGFDDLIKDEYNAYQADMVMIEEQRLHTTKTKHYEQMKKRMKFRSARLKYLQGLLQTSDPIIAPFKEVQQPESSKKQQTKSSTKQQPKQNLKGVGGPRWKR